jgi:hypothetical protein
MLIEKLHHPVTGASSFFVILSEAKNLSSMQPRHGAAKKERFFASLRMTTIMVLFAQEGGG